MHLLLLLLAAGLAHAGWTQTATHDGCTYFRGDKEPSGATPMRVVCDWDVDPAALQAVLAAAGDHEQVFTSLRDAETVSRSGGTERVRQVQRAAGASDRELIVAIETTPVDGGARFSWKKCSDQSERQGVGVEPEMSEGYWQVVDRGGRSELTYELRYLAGGNVPALLVRWFQGSGIKAVLTDLRGFMRNTHGR